MYGTRLLCALALAAGSCATAKTTGDASAARRFGPVLGRDAIVGRVDVVPGHILLLVRGVGLVSVDLDNQQFATTPVPSDLARTCWGFARLPDGSLWTLKDRHTLSRLDATGTVLQEFPLSATHLGLLAVGDRLVYQTMDAGTGRGRIEAGPPGEAGRQPWTAMAERSFELNAASVTALNLVACGESRTPERPCWFPDETAVTLVHVAGASRRVELAGLTHVSPEILLTADNPPRPIRGAYIDASGTIWILSTGLPPPGVAPAPGAWLLGRYRTDGALVDLRQLKQPVRVILRAENGRAWLLASDGYVIEISS